jgi:hypothetical protein
MIGSPDVRRIGHRHRDVLLVPALPIPGLVAPNEEDCFPVGIKREQDADATADGSQLLHIVVAAGFDPVDKGPTE